MKKSLHLLFTIPTFLALISCQPNGNGGTDFADTKIKDFDSLKSLGIGSKLDNGGAGKKEFRAFKKNPNLKLKNEKESKGRKNPYHLIGDYGNGINELTVLAKNSGQAKGEYSITEFSDFGNYAAFRIEKDNEKPTDGLHYCDSEKIEYVYKDNCLVFKAHNGATRPYYFVSKKTGNIYLLDNRIIAQYGDKFYCFGGIPETGDDSEGFIGRLEEVDGQIKIQSFVTSKAIGGFDGEEVYRFNCDRWGNFGLKGHIYSESVKRLKLDVDLSFDHFSQVYTTKDCRQYVNKNGELADREISFEVKGEAESDWLDEWASKTDPSTMILLLGEQEYSVLLNESETDRYYYHEKYGIFHITFQDSNRISYALEFYPLEAGQNFAARGDYLYYYKDEEILRFNFKAGESESIPLPEGYVTTSLVKEDDGTLKISGYNDSLQSFEAYILEDGTISFEKVVQEYVVILITPINR